MLILINTPIWVWFILIFLIVMGIRQIKPRIVRPAQLLIVPAIFLPLLIISILKTNAIFIGFIALLVGILVGILLGKTKWKNNPLIVKSNNQWQQKSSVYPLVLYIAIFVSRYITTALPFIEPNLPVPLPPYVQPIFIGLTGCGIGALLSIVIFKKDE